MATDAHQVYMSGEHAPFRCDHCEYYAAADSCRQPDIIALAKDGEFGLSMRGKFAKVDPNGCSDYFEPTTWGGR